MADLRVIEIIFPICSTRCGCVKWEWDFASLMVDKKVNSPLTSSLYGDTIRDGLKAKAAGKEIANGKEGCNLNTSFDRREHGRLSSLKTTIVILSRHCCRGGQHENSQ